MIAAMIELFCDSFEQIPRRILVSISTTPLWTGSRRPATRALQCASTTAAAFSRSTSMRRRSASWPLPILRPGKTMDGAGGGAVGAAVIGAASAPAGRRFQIACAVTVIAGGPRPRGVVRASAASAAHLRPSSTNSVLLQAGRPYSPRTPRSGRLCDEAERGPPLQAISVTPPRAGIVERASSPEARPDLKGPTAASSSPTCGSA